MNSKKQKKQEIGKKKSFNLSKHFRKESSHFTPWLADNLDVISDEIGVPLINPSTEQSSENFRVDIVAEKNDGSKVVIENQFGPSDHDHLGKIITYRTAHDAKIAIWIVERAKQEHIDAINWLNETDNGCDFYLLEARLIQINDSLPALDVSKIAGPSQEIREKGTIKRKDARRYGMREKFWEVLLDEFNNDSSFDVFKDKTPHTSNTIDVKTGVKGLWWSLKLSQHSLCCRVYIDRKISPEDNLEILKKIKKESKKIEKKFGDKLIWDEHDGDRAATVEYQLSGGWEDPEEKWPELAKNDLDKVKSFVNALKGPIAKLSM